MTTPSGLSSSPTFAYPGRGDRIADRYRVERKIGAGGMGVVVAAVDEMTGARVAVKLLLPEGPGSAFAHQDASGVVERSHRRAELSARLLREANAAARLSSAHVTRVLDVGRSGHEGDPFVVMELLEGMDLGRYVKERGPLPIPEAVTLVLQACEAIAEAHALGIVHRDLKPANLFLTRAPDGSPFVKVLDFGISKVLGSDDSQLTATSDLLGSPLYMSPEQIRSARDVDARADVWSLGAILYRLIAGRAAFASPGSAATLAAIIGDPPEPLRAARPDVPPELEKIILRCLEKDRTLRLPSVRELAILLTRFSFVQSGSYAPAALPPPPPELPSPSPATGNVLSNASASPWSRGRWLFGLAALGGMLAALVVGTLTAKQDPSPAPEGSANAPGAVTPEAPSAAVTATAVAPEPPAAGAATTEPAAAGAASSPEPEAPSAPPASTAVPTGRSTAGRLPVRVPRPQGAPPDDPLGDRL